LRDDRGRRSQRSAAQHPHQAHLSDQVQAPVAELLAKDAVLLLKVLQSTCSFFEEISLSCEHHQQALKRCDRPVQRS
jgi:hypothetical protein